MQFSERGLCARGFDGLALLSPLKMPVLAKTEPVPWSAAVIAAVFCVLPMGSRCFFLKRIAAERKLLLLQVQAQS